MRLSPALILPLGAASAALAQGDVWHIGSRDVLLTVASGPSAARPTVYVSEDDRVWRVAATEPAGANQVLFHARQDGSYHFYFAWGEHEAPSAPTTAHVSVVVDTATPTLQVHEVRPEPSGKRLLFRATLVDDNLAPTAARVFYRSGNAAWADGGAAHARLGGFDWELPADATDTLDLRVVVTDRAGNRTQEERLAVRTRPAQPVAVAPTELVPAEDVAERAGATDAAAAAPVSGEGARLRALAKEFRDQGQYSLAAARLEDALRLAPQDVELLVELGDTLFRNVQFDEARVRFERALEVAPSNTDALQGLALVDAAQRRYDQARDRLLQLVALEPESQIFWLRLGDVQHKLGAFDQARSAWQRVAVLGPPGSDWRAKAELRLSTLTGRP
jgi:tetratricopeptide (TPR) repeat protein